MIMMMQLFEANSQILVFSVKHVVFSFKQVSTLDYLASAKQCLLELLYTAWSRCQWSVPLFPPALTSTLGDIYA